MGILIDSNIFIDLERQGRDVRSYVNGREEAEIFLSVQIENRENRIPRGQIGAAKQALGDLRRDLTVHVKLVYSMAMQQTIDTDDVVERIATEIRPILTTAPVERAYVFGSCARREHDEESDVDILIEATAGALSLLSFGELEDRLRGALNCKVDLVTRRSLNDFIRDDVEREMILIYEKANGR